MHALRTRWLHQTALALYRAWHRAAPSTIAQHPMLLARSVAILKALQKYTTHHPAHAALQRALTQLETLEQLYKNAPTILDTPPAAQYVPWFQTHFPYPATYADLTLDAEWKKQLKALRHDPYQRLELALSKLPYRLAYQEAILALRAIIRNNNKERMQALELLYWLAASASFLESPSTTPAGDSIIAALKGSTLQQLPIDYQQLGTQHLKLLNRTDQKNLEQAFGACDQHCTLAELQPAIWNAYQQRLSQITAANT